MKMNTLKKILRIFFCNLFLIICGFSISNAADQNKVVVVPLFNSSTGSLVENFVNVENILEWGCPPSPNSLSFSAECPTNCIAIGGACSAKTVADSTDLNITGGNFLKTDGQLSKYNAYQCWMFVSSCSDPADPPVGYVQVICYCDN